MNVDEFSVLFSDRINKERELISTQKLKPQQSKKILNHLPQLSPYMQVNARYVKSTKGTFSKGSLRVAPRMHLVTGDIYIKTLK